MRDQRVAGALDGLLTATVLGKCTVGGSGRLSHERSSNLGTLVDFRGCRFAQPRIALRGGWRVRDHSRRSKGSWPSRTPFTRRDGYRRLVPISQAAPAG